MTSILLIKPFIQCLGMALLKKVEALSKPETVHFIDWENPDKNHFAIAEEVTIRGEKTKRPDIVLYINGIAIGVLELKRQVFL